MSADEFKQQGTNDFKAGNFAAAIENYTKALELTPDDHTILGNRSAAYLKMNDAENALQDGQKCIDIKPDWAKGYQRKGMALQAQGKNEEALEALQKGLEIEPNNAQIQGCIQNLQASNDPIFGPQGLAKLMQDPTVAGYFADVDFKNKFELCRQQPQMLMQLMQSDPRFMHVFKVATGIDLMDMSQKA